MAPSVRMRQACRSLSELSEEGFFFNAKNEVVAVCHNKAGERELGCGAMATALCHHLNSKVYCENHRSMLADQIYTNVPQWPVCSWRPVSSPPFSNKTCFRYKAHFDFINTNVHYQTIF